MFFGEYFDALGQKYSRGNNTRKDFCQKMKNKIITLFICAALLFCLAVPVFAVNAGVGMGNNAGNIGGGTGSNPIGADGGLTDGANGNGLSSDGLTGSGAGNGSGMMNGGARSGVTDGTPDDGLAEDGLNGDDTLGDKNGDGIIEDDGNGLAGSGVNDAPDGTLNTTGGNGTGTNGTGTNDTNTNGSGTNDSGTNDSNGGMSWAGIIIAVLVAAALVAVVIALLPKRKGS